MAALPPRRWHALQSPAVQRALAAPAHARSGHFVLHCLMAPPLFTDLRTELAPERDRSVDNAVSVSTGVGFVVPKKWARRAVTRNLIRRQMREAVRRNQKRIGVGATVLLRQRAALNGALFASAASVAMRDAVRAELDLLFSQLPDAAP